MTDPFVASSRSSAFTRRAGLGRHRADFDEGAQGAHRPLLQMHANERKEIKEVRAGDIAAVSG